jgi:hypothetical protein
LGGSSSKNESPILGRPEFPVLSGNGSVFLGPKYENRKAGVWCGDIFIGRRLSIPLFTQLDCCQTNVRSRQV